MDIGISWPLQLPALDRFGHRGSNGGILLPSPARGKMWIEQLNASDEGQGTEAMANAITKLSARVCRLMLQEYQRAASAPEQQ